MLKEYTITIVTSMGNREHIAWFVGEGEGTVEIPNAAWSNNSFHVSRTEMSQLVFSENKSEAKKMTSKNMQSWLGRVLAQLPYADINVKEIRIALAEEVDDAIRRTGNTNRAFVEQKRAERAEQMVERLIDVGNTLDRWVVHFRSKEDATTTTQINWHALVAEWQANQEGDSNV